MDDRAAAAASGLSPRSIALGLVGGGLICLLAPYNDLAMQNTPLVGNNLPLGATLLMLLFVTVVNAALHRWRPARAWAAHELSVSYALMLSMGALPSTGLIRYLLPNLVMPFRIAVEQPSAREVLANLHLAPWLFPSFGDTPAVGHPLAVGFVDRWADPSRSPYGAWVVPFVAWGVFVGALAWSLLCVVCIVLRQWREREHLPFPLVGVQLALLEAPEPGRAWNRTLRSRAFWLAFASVFALHANNGLATYFPKQVVQISRGFDLTSIFAGERPWSYFDASLYKATVYFSLVGIAYFLSSPVAFSLWFFVIAMELYRMAEGLRTGDPGVPGLTDQRVGVALAYLLTILWLGRQHWAVVVRQAFRGAAPGEPRGSYLSYRAAFWGLVGGAAVMVAWLVAAGVTVAPALVFVASLLAAFLLITRLIAETGLLHGAMPVSVLRPFDLLALYAGIRIPPSSYYLGSTLQATFYDYRETVPVYASHGLRLLDETRPHPRADHGRRIGRRVIAWLAVAIALSYGISFWSSLWTHYHYSVTLDAAQVTPIDKWGVQDNPTNQLLAANVNYASDANTLSYDRGSHLLFGFGAATVLTVMRWRFAWWPLHPVGYLIAGLFPSVAFWFSIFLGWSAKRLLLWLGSAPLYERCKPLFLGLIFGETASAGAWAIASHVLHALGVPYRSYLVLPQ